MPRDLVLLHPFPMDARFWEPLRAILPPVWRIATPEAPGFGSAPRRPGWAVADWADEVAERIAAGPGRAVVLGLSMGGYAALAIAARRPEVLEALVLADTRAEADTDEARAGRAAGVDRIAADGGTSGFLDGFLPRVTGPAAPEALRAWLRSLAADQSPEAVSDALRALAGRPDRRPDLAAVAVPTRVVVGAADALTPPEAARVIADGIPGARLVVVPGAGHMTAVEDPPAVAAVLAELT